MSADSECKLYRYESTKVQGSIKQPLEIRHFLSAAVEEAKGALSFDELTRTLTVYNATLSKSAILRLRCRGFLLWSLEKEGRVISKKAAKRLAKAARNRTPEARAFRKEKRMKSKAIKRSISSVNKTNTLSSYRDGRNVRNVQADRSVKVIILPTSVRFGNITMRLRAVAPYVYKFECAAKERWVGESLLNILRRAFTNGDNSLPLEYYTAAISAGTLTIDDAQTSPDTIIHQGAILRHTLIRREPPVWVTQHSVAQVNDVDNSSDSKGGINNVDISNENCFSKYIHIKWIGDVGVVNKPAGMPVHPCGPYRHNSVLHSLETQLSQTVRSNSSREDNFQYKKFKRDLDNDSKNDVKLYPAHRLDRLTSGLLLICRTVEAVRELSSKIKLATDSTNKDVSNVSNTSRFCRKRYVARVAGFFPDGVVNCDERIHKLESSSSRRCCHPDGQYARTSFKRMHYSTNTSENHDKEHKDIGYSIVECFPETGRTHQIRCHLSHIGFPIENDPIYADDGNNSQWVERNSSKIEEMKVALRRFKKWQTSQLELQIRENNQCNENELQNLKNIDCGPKFSHEQLYCTGIWLHALSYDINGRHYEVPLPEWAIK